MNILLLLLVYLFSLAVIIFLKPKNKSFFGNSIYLLFAFGFIFYGGTSISKYDIPLYYIIMYFVFLLALGFSYNFFYKAMAPLELYSLNKLNSLLIPFVENNAKKIIAVFYILTLLPLVFPSFRLDLITSPPAPDLVGNFERRIEGEEKHIIIQISSLMKLLLVPFFYLAIFYFRRNLPLVVLMVFSIFYLEYVDATYKSRGEFIAAFFPIIFYFWHFLRKYRKAMIIFLITAMPIALIFFNFFEYYRLGADVTISEFSFPDSFEHILNAETSFPEVVGLPIIESGARVDLGAYFAWIFTLPVPKFIFGEIAGARINTEISELFLGIFRGNTGFYVVLPGLVAESVYIFGEYFYWVHAVFFGVIIAMLTRIFQGDKRFVFFIGYIAILLMYNTNRGGVSSSLPQIINQFLPIYLILFFALFKRR